MSIREQIKALELKREESKAELFELYAEQADQKFCWTAYQESTPLKERLELEADIKDLEAERQHSKVELMRLKAKLREANEISYRQIVEEVLSGNMDTTDWEAGDFLQEIKTRYNEQTQGE